MATSTEQDPPDLYNLYAQEVKHMPPGWRWFALDSAAEAAPDGWLKVEGAVAPDGDAMWSKRTRGTEKTIFVNRNEFNRWKQDKAMAEDRCHECWGATQVWFGWSAATGHRYRPCQTCNGTGKPAAAGLEPVRDVIAKAIDAEISAERERCAKLCETLTDLTGLTVPHRNRFAAAIRSTPIATSPVPPTKEGT